MAPASVGLASEGAHELACEVVGVTKAFGAVRAVDDVSLDIGAGSLTCLIGPNGAGKSTLLGCIFGFHPVDAGYVRVGGRDVFRFGRGNSLRFRGESIYHDIMPERRIVSSDIVSEGDVRLWVAATTLELTPMGPRTQLKLTAQVVWLDGADDVEGSDACYAALLAGLDRHLGGNPHPRPAPRA